VDRVLNEYIRPIFSQAAHQGRVDTQTGRAAPSLPAAAVVDEPAWMSHMPIAGHIPLGAPCVLAWCVAQIRCARDARAWERFWPQLLPPIMVLLDASGARAKVHGACVALQMLDQGSAELAQLLQRTGMATLLDESLSRMLYFMTDAADGPLVLCAALAARQALSFLTEGKVRFEMQCALLSEGVLAALAYCAPASASMPALEQNSMYTSPRLQQALSGTAAAWACVLWLDLGSPSVRFLDAWMDWAAGWLEHALSASGPTFPPCGAPKQDLSAAVQAVEQGELVTPPPAASMATWNAAARVQLQSITQCALATQALVHISGETKATVDGLPPYAPCLHSWSLRLTAAACKALLRLGSMNVHDDVKDAVDALSGALNALCQSIHDAVPAIAPVRARSVPSHAAS
jgi:hypothetical protein